MTAEAQRVKDLLAQMQTAAGLPLPASDQHDQTGSSQLQSGGVQPQAPVHTTESILADMQRLAGVKTSRVEQ